MPRDVQDEAAELIRWQTALDGSMAQQRAQADARYSEALAGVSVAIRDRATATQTAVASARADLAAAQGRLNQTNSQQPTTAAEVTAWAAQRVQRAAELEGYTSVLNAALEQDRLARADVARGVATFWRGKLDTLQLALTQEQASNAAAIQTAQAALDAARTTANQRNGGAALRVQEWQNGAALLGVAL